MADSADEDLLLYGEVVNLEEKPAEPEPEKTSSSEAKPGVSDPGHAQGGLTEDSLDGGGALSASHDPGASPMRGVRALARQRSFACSPDSCLVLLAEADEVLDGAIRAADQGEGQTTEAENKEAGDSDEEDEDEEESRYPSGSLLDLFSRMTSPATMMLTSSLCPEVRSLMLKWFPLPAPQLPRPTSHVLGTTKVISPSSLTSMLYPRLMVPPSIS